MRVYQNPGRARLHEPRPGDDKRAVEQVFAEEQQRLPGGQSCLAILPHMAASYPGRSVGR